MCSSSVSDTAGALQQSVSVYASLFAQALTATVITALADHITCVAAVFQIQQVHCSSHEVVKCR
jgi:hypothetical protein